MFSLTVWLPSLGVNTGMGRQYGSKGWTCYTCAFTQRVGVISDRRYLGLLRYAMPSMKMFIPSLYLRDTPQANGCV